MLSSDEAGSYTDVTAHTEELMREAWEADQPALIEAPPSSKKTTTAIELAHESTKPVIYLAGRIDLYEQAENLSDDLADIRVERIPSPNRCCDTFKGKTDVDSSEVKRLYRKGYSARRIHSSFEDKTPCGKSCDYLKSMRELEAEIDSVDLLIGNHQHATREKYVQDRIVIVDEFNPDPFLRPFPNPDSNINDTPGEIIAEFLDKIAEKNNQFPSDEYQDVTDLLEKRAPSPERADAIDWFEQHEVDPYTIQESNLINPSLDQYDKSHTYAPLLAFSLLCMERVCSGIEVAPPSDGRLSDSWQKAGLHPALKCLRNRNTGKMYVLEPPDLSSAEQVIGLDGTPTKELWNLLFAPETGFNHKQVISRDDYTRYLRSAMNMSLRQIGNGRHPYSGGKTSPLDKQRFAAVHAIEGEKFALISTKKALKRYKQKGLIRQFVTRANTQENKSTENRVSKDRQALHYGLIKSSNELDNESLGVVAGMPHPSDKVINRWAGLCHHNVGDCVDGETTEISADIEQHFTKKQVVQAVFRFGRDLEDEETTVYVSTTALPDWFDIQEDYTVESVDGKGMVIGKLLEIYRKADRTAESFRTASDIATAINEDEQFPSAGNKGSKTITEQRVRDMLNDSNILEYLQCKKNAGKHAADIYRWDSDGQILYPNNSDILLVVDDHIFDLPLPKSWANTL